MTSEIRANTLKNRVGLGTVSFTNTGPVVSGIVTATGADINGDLDVDGHTNLDNVSIAGVTTFTEVVTASEGVFIPDNKELKIGNTAGSPDTKIFHNGSKTRLVSTAQYDMDADIIDIHNASGNAMKARFLNNQVELYHNNNLRVQTDTSRTVFRGSAGIAVYGDAGQNQNGQISIHPQGSAVYSNLFFYNAAGNSYASIIGHAGGTLFFTGGTNSPLRHRVNGSGFHSFQEDNTQRVTITAGGSVNIGADFTQTTYKLKVTGTSYLNGVVRVPNGSAAAPAIHFGDSDSGLYGDSSNGVRITAGGSDRIVATSNGVTFPIKATALTSFTLGSQSALSKPLYFADAASVESASILLDNTSQELRIKNGRFSGQITFTTYNTEKLRINQNGKVIIGNDGTTFGNAAVQAFIQHGNTAGESGFSSVDTSSVAAGVGGEIAFHGKYNTGAQDYAYFGHIRGTKENATAGDTACALKFFTRPNAVAPQERLRITSDGIIETGTAIGDSAYDGNQRLRVGRTGDCSISIRANGSTTAATGLDFGDDDDDRAGRIQYVHNGNYMSFHTNGAGTGSANEQLRITSGGNVGINETNPQQQLHVHDDNNYKGILINGNSAPRIAFARSTTTTGEWSVGIDGTNGNNFVINRSNDNSNRYFVISNGQTNSNQNTVVNGVLFNNDIRSTTSTNDDSTSHVSIAARNAAGGHGEYFIVGVSGNIYFGAGANSYSSNPSGNNVNGGTTIRVYGGISSNAYNDAHRFGRNTDGSIVIFQSAGGTEGSIAISGSTTNYNTSSDYRLKDNIVNITDGITRLKQLKPRRFNFIKDPSITKDGFIAHEVDSIVPEAVTGTKDETFSKDDEDNNVKAGDPKYQHMDASKLIPLLTAALQEAITEIETLKTKVAALEGS